MLKRPSCTGVLMHRDTLAWQTMYCDNRANMEKTPPSGIIPITKHHVAKMEKSTGQKLTKHGMPRFMANGCSWAPSLRRNYPEPLTELAFARLATRTSSGRQRRSNNALLTTLTLLKAMAAPASIGFNSPAAARGIPTAL